MARRQSQASRRGRQSQSKTNPLPFIIGGVLLLGVIVAFAVSGSGDDDNPQDDNKKTKQASSKTNANKKAADTPTKKTGKLYDGKTRAEWRALRKKADMTLWRTIEGEMAAALKLRGKALEARKSGNESSFKKLMTQAVQGLARR